jgi:ketosteroid isomerase-like protein
MRTKALILSTVLLLVAGAGLTNPANSLADDRQAVEEATARFYASLNALFTGDAGPMAEIWSHADDVTYLGPAGEFLVGWNEVRGAWESQAALKLGGRVEPYEMRITVGNDLAFTQCFEKGTNLDAQGEPVRVSIRATNLFRKENGAWKMIGHHTDLLPFLEKQLATPATE